MENTISKENKYTISVKQKDDNNALISLKLTVIGLNGVENATEIEKAFLSYYSDLCTIAKKISA